MRSGVNVHVPRGVARPPVTRIWRFRTGFVGILSLAMLIAAGACVRRPAGNAEAEHPTYPLAGEVLAVDREKNVLRIHHEEVAGLMPSMVMEFPVSAGDAAIAKVGSRVRGSLVDYGGGDLRLEHVWPDNAADRRAVDEAATMLRQDTTIRGKGAYREIGETVPDFTLYDQDGNTFTIGRLRGKQFMLNFIYTRCPVPTMCPLATQNMMAAQQLAREAGVGDVEFVSISLDPSYDTPGVLREYADLRGIDTSNFTFLTGPTPAVEDLLTQFGVLSGKTEAGAGLLAHTLATLLIDANGRIVHRVDGSNWDPKEFVALMKR